MQELLDRILEIAEDAGRATLPYFVKGGVLNIQHKLDNTPVTQADIAAHAVIKNDLEKLPECYPIISEEDGMWENYAVRKQWQRYWLIDPLDGTKGFVNHLPEYTVNIALIENHQPILGVVYAPASHACYFALKGEGAFKRTGYSQQKLKVKHKATERLKVLIGQYHRPKSLAKLEAMGPTEVMRLNSSMKFCYLAEGLADLYPRFGPTSEWDTAAGQLILEEAGGLVVDFAGQTLQYNAKSSLLNPRFLALADSSRLEALLNTLNS